MSRPFLLLAALLLALPATAQPILRHTFSGPELSGDPYELREEGGLLYFIGRTGNRAALQSYDPATSQLRTLGPDSLFVLSGGGSRYLAPLIQDGSIYFLAGFQTGGLYRYDIATDQTTNVGTNVCLPRDFNAGLVPYDDRIFFPATRCTEGGMFLHVYDPATGTLGLAPEPAGGIPSNGTRPIDLIVHDGRLFFSAQTVATGSELFAYDAATNETTLAHEFVAGAAGGGGRPLASLGGLLYVVDQARANNPVVAYNDTTGTVARTDITVGTNYALIPFQDKLILAREGFRNNELSAYDPASGFISILAEVRPGSEGSAPAGMTVIGDSVFYFASPVDGEQALFVYDGANGTTTKLYDVFTRLSRADRNGIARVGNTVYFGGSPTTDRSATEMHQYDLATNTGSFAFEVNPATGRADIRDLYDIGGRVYFGATAPTPDLASFDPASGTTSVGLTGLSTTGRHVVSLGDLIYFTGTSDSTGAELSTYDPATGQVRQVSDIRPGPTGGVSDFFVGLFGDEVIFNASDGTFDGSGTYGYDPATEQIRFLDRNIGSDAVELRDTLYFTLRETSQSFGVGAYDAASDSSYIAATIGTTQQGLFVDLTLVGDTLYFLGRGDPANSYNLYALGGAGQPVQPKLADALLADRNLNNLRVYDGKLYFQANTSAGASIRQYDPATGAIMVIYQADLSDRVRFAAGAGGKIYFVTSDANNGDKQVLRAYTLSTGAFEVVQRYSGFESPFPVIGVGNTLVVIVNTDAGPTQLYTVDATITVSNDNASETAGLTARVMPNPTSGAARVVIGGAAGETSVRLYDTLGREVARVHDGLMIDGATLTLPTERLSAGVYFVVVRSPSGTRTQSLTVVR